MTPQKMLTPSKVSNTALPGLARPGSAGARPARRRWPKASGPRASWRAVGPPPRPAGVPAGAGPGHGGSPPYSPVAGIGNPGVRESAGGGRSLSRRRAVGATGKAPPTARRPAPVGDASPAHRLPPAASPLTCTSRRPVGRQSAHFGKVPGTASAIRRGNRPKGALISRTRASRPACREGGNAEVNRIPGAAGTMRAQRLPVHTAAGPHGARRPVPAPYSGPRRETARQDSQQAAAATSAAGASGSSA